MALPQLPAFKTITKPATKEKTFDSWFLSKLRLNADENSANVRITCTRYDYQNKELSDQQIVSNKNPYKEVQQWQCWKDAMQALLNCVTLEAQREEMARELSSARKTRKAMLKENKEADTTKIDTTIKTLKESKDQLEAYMGPLK